MSQLFNYLVVRFTNVTQRTVRIHDLIYFVVDFVLTLVAYVQRLRPDYPINLPRHISRTVVESFAIGFSLRILSGLEQERKSRISMTPGEMEME